MPSPLKTTVQTLQSALDAADRSSAWERGNLNDATERFLSILSPISLSRARLSFPYREKNECPRAQGQPTCPAGRIACHGGRIRPRGGRRHRRPSPAPSRRYPGRRGSHRALRRIRAIQPRQPVERHPVAAQRSSVASRTGNIISMRQSFRPGQGQLQKTRNAAWNARNSPSRSSRRVGRQRRRLGPGSVSLEAKAALRRRQRGRRTPSDIAVSGKQPRARSVAALDTARNRLADAQETMNDLHRPRAFAGVVAQVASSRSDQASPSTAMASSSPKPRSTITLNEVDVARVKNGQKATFTFDAIQDLSIAGTIAGRGPDRHGFWRRRELHREVAFQGDDRRIKQAWARRPRSSPMRAPTS